MATASTSRSSRIGDTGIKNPVKVATTANITLSGEQTIDGVACVTGDSVLVKNQTSSINNGVYVVDTGAWTRRVDFDGVYDIEPGTLVYAYSGTSNSGPWRVANTTTPTIGTDAVTFSRVYAAVSASSLTDGADGDVWLWTRTFTGSHATGAGPLNGFSPSAYMFDVFTDDADVGTSFMIGVQERHRFGGSATKGARTGHYTQLVQTAATSPSNLFRNYAAFQASMYAEANDNGTNTGLGALGSYFGMGAAVYTAAAATNLYAVASAEFNTFLTAGSSMRYQLGLTIAAANAVRGATYDCALNISGLTDTITHVGWTSGILFSAANGAEPFYSGSTIIQSVSTGTVSRGIDFSTHTITNEILRGAYSKLSENTLTLGDNAGAATIAVNGPTANASLYVAPKGTGSIYLRSGAGDTMMRFDTVASGNNSLVVTPAVNGAAPAISSAGTSDANVDIAFTPKGSGNLKFGTFNGTGDVVSNGYITIKDSGGTARKIMITA